MLDEDIKSFVLANMLAIDLPPDVKAMFCEEVVDTMNTTMGSTESTELNENINKKQQKRKGYLPREFMKRAPKEASAWHLR